MRIKILLLEDEEVLAKMYRNKLEEAGFEVKWINRLKDIEQTLITLKPEIFLLDQSIGVEEKSGMDLIPDIKKILPQAKIIMLSNYSDFHLKNQALNTGADDYLVKIDTPPRVLVQYVQNLH